MKTTPEPSTLEREYSRLAVESPIGLIQVIADTDAIVAILWDTDAELTDGDAHNPVDRRLEGATIVWSEPGQNEVLDRAAEQLTEYFAGARTEFDLPLAPIGTEFQQVAWAALRRIPYGETISYGQQADAMGDRKKARAVGAANGKNPIPIVVPCHRVVGSNGHLTGFAGGIGVKAWLLDHERAVASR